MKPTRPIHTLWTVRAAAALLFLLGGCGKVGPRTLSSDDLAGAQDRTSPLRVLENIAVAYREKSIALYANQLHPDLTVRFLEGAPSNWSKGTCGDRAKDISSTRSLFGAAQRITCTMQYDAPTPSTVEGYPAADGYQQIRVCPLKVTIIPTGNAAPMIVNDSLLYVFAPKDSAGQRTWTVVCQRMLTRVDGGT